MEMNFTYKARTCCYILFPPLLMKLIWPWLLLLSSRKQTPAPLAKALWSFRNLSFQREYFPTECFPQKLLERGAFVLHRAPLTCRAGGARAPRTRTGVAHTSIPATLTGSRADTLPGPQPAAVTAGRPVTHSPDTPLGLWRQPLQNPIAWSRERPRTPPSFHTLCVLDPG